MTGAESARSWRECGQRIWVRSGRRASRVFSAASSAHPGRSGLRRCGSSVRNRVPPTRGGNEKVRRIEMVINMAAGATEAQLEHVIERVKECGFQPHVTRGSERAIV